MEKDEELGMDERRSSRYMRCKQRYLKERKIGEGTYAVVYEGTDLSASRQIAIKKIKMSSSIPGLDISALRELKVLKTLRHMNIVELIDVYSSRNNLQLVLAHYPYDLEKIIRERQMPFSAGDIKSWLLMVLRGLEHMHQQFVLHRDLKPSNLLIGTDGILRIGDFGLARTVGLPVSCTNDPFLNMSGQMTSQVVTRWYRAPELLLGARHYGPAMDVWAVGCIFAELLLRTPFLPGDSDINQLSCMCRALGTPRETEWPGMRGLPDYIALPEHPRPDLAAIFPAVSADALQLLGKMLTWDPSQRCTVRGALFHPYFVNEPMPTPPHLLPKPGRSSLGKVAAMEPKRLFT